MSNQDPLKNWQLENRGANPEQWKLQDAEQDLSKHMQLQPDEAAGSQWQPVEYQRAARPRGRNWILPSIVIAALLGVLGYVGWIALSQFGGSPFNVDPAQLVAGISGAATDPTPTETVAAVVATEAPTPLPVAPTAVPTPAPTATAVPEAAPTVSLAELITGTVNAVGGVNARNAPATTGEVLRTLDQGLLLSALSEQEGWLQVLLDDNTTAWVSAEFVDVVRQQVPLEQVNALRARAGLAPLAGAETGAPAAISEATPATAAVTLPVTVIGQPIINARLTPALDGTVVQSLNVSTTLTAIGRTEAGDWLAVQLPEGTLAWVLGTLVAATGDTTTLSVLDPASFAPASAVTVTSTVTTPAVALAAPAVLVTNGVVPAAPFTNTLPATGPALTISDTVGVNVRATPGTEGAVLTVAPNGAVLAVTGRSADRAWLRVSLPDGQAGWMFAEAVIASPDAAQAPVAEGATAETPVEPAPAAPVVPTGPTALATITNPLGANLRSAPSRDLDPVIAFAQGDTLTAVGRSADNEWVQVALPDGTLAWALATTVQLDTGIETLAVTQE